MPALAYFAFAIDAPVAPLFTPFGWCVLIGLAAIVMAPGLVEEIVMREGDGI